MLVHEYIFIFQGKLEILRKQKSSRAGYYASGLYKIF